MRDIVTWEGAPKPFVDKIIANLRGPDREELYVATGQDPAAVIRESVELEGELYTFTVDGEPAMLFGIVQHPTVPLAGVPWAVGTPLVDIYAKSLTKRCLPAMHIAMDRYTEGLCNVVHAKNDKHIRWLKWAGFTFTQPIPWGPFGELFIPFYTKPCVSPPQSS